MERTNIWHKLIVPAILLVLFLAVPALAGAVIPDNVSNANSDFISAADDAGASTGLHGNDTSGAGTYTVNPTVAHAAGSTTTQVDQTTVSGLYPQPLPAYRNVNIYVANDEGVKYDEPNGVTNYAGIGIPYNYVENTYFVMFGQTSGGTNLMDISNDPTGRKGIDGQVTRTTDQSGEFWVTLTGSLSYMHEGILMLAVNDTIPNDFSVRIRSSGYDFDPPIPGVGNNETISDLTYVEGAIDQTFTKDDFIYGPQIWRPCGTADFPIYDGQDMSDAENTFQLMFIDLGLGATKTGTDQGSIKVEYQFNNLTSFAVFNSYGWYRASNHGTGVIMTNYGSYYAVIGDGTFAPPVAPAANFTVNVTSGDAPFAVQFTDASTGNPTSWAWDFENDGVIDSTEQNPLHTYATAGVYSINLTVANAFGNDVEVKADYITVSPSSATIELPQQNGLNLSVVNKQRPSLYDTEHPGTYFFNIGNNQYNGGQNAIHISDSYLTADGTITTSSSPTDTFYITDTGGKGYEDEAILLIAVQENEHSTDFSIDLAVEGYRFLDHAADLAPTEAEVGTFNSDAYTATLNASNFLKYNGQTVSQTWKPSTDSVGGVNKKFFNGQDLAGPRYNLILVDLNTSIVGRNAAYQANLTNYGSPKVTYTIHDYHGGNVSFAPYAYVSYQTGGGSYFDRTVGWTSRSSDSSWLVTLGGAETALVANFTANVTSGDVPLAVQFTDLSTGSPTEWLWDFGDGADSTEQNPQHTYDTAGTYTVSLAATSADGSDTTTSPGYITVTMPGGSLLADTPWPKFGYDINNTGRSPYNGPQTNTTKWITSLGGSIRYSGPAIGSDGTIYIGTYGDYNLSAIDANGTRKWKFPTGGIIYNTPAITADGTIHFGSYDGNLYALNPDGTEKWRYNNSGQNFASPAIGRDGTIYYGSKDTYLYAVNPNGTLKWSYATGGEIYDTPAIDPDGTIYIGSGDNSLYAINPDGTLKWKYETSHYVYSGPTIGPDGTIYIANHGSMLGSYGHTIYAINPDGTLKWKYNPAGYSYYYSSPVIGKDGTVYITSWEKGTLFALNPDGTEEWRCATGEYVYGTPVIGADGTIYLGSYDSSTSGNIYAVNPDGSVKWKYPVATRLYSSPSIGSDGTLYIGGGDGNLYAIENVVDFTTDANEGGDPLTVQFTGTSTRSITSWSWDFGDGTTSTEQNPSHTYGPGSFTVNLTVTDDNGTHYSAVKPGYINVYAAPAAAFSADPTSGQAPLVVQFTDDSSGSLASWAWDFEDDGIVDSTEQNPSYTYTTAGTYSVNLTVSNAVGSDSEMKTGYITVGSGGSGGNAPVADFTADVTNGKAPLTVNFTDLSTGSPASWFWDFGDDTNATEQNPQHTYAAAGTYDVSLTATNADGSDTAIKTDYVVARSTNAVPLPAGRSFNLYVANDEGVKYNVENGVTDSSKGYTPYVFIDNTYHFLYNSALGGGTNALHVSNDPSIARGQVTTTTNQSGEFWLTFTGGQPNLHDAVLLLAVNGTIPDDFSVRIRSNGYDFEPPIPGVGNNNTISDPVYVDGAINQTFTREDFIYGPQIWRPHRVSDYPVFVGQNMSDADNTFELMFIDLWLGCTQTKSDGYIKVEYEFNNLTTFAVFNAYGWYSASEHGTGLIMTASGSEYGVIGDGTFAPVAPVANFTANMTTGDAPLSVQFTDASTGSPTAWAWDFENDGIVDSTEQNPVFTYTTAGTYTVNLTAANTAGSDSEVKTGYITVSSPYPQPLPNHRNINIYVANDEGVKYDEPNGVTNYADIPYNYVENTYFVMFGASGGGTSPMDISNNATGKKGVDGQVTRTTNQSGAFWVTFSGGQSYMHEGILMLAVNDTIPDDFSVRIRSSGYDFEPPIPGFPNNETISNLAYVEGAIDQTFTKDDFIYGPQIWRPFGTADLPIYEGQDMSDAENTFQLMFIDLYLGATKTETDQGSIKVEYQFNNLTSFAVFNSYGWYRASNHGTGIIMTNYGSDYAVIGDGTYAPVAPVANFTANVTSGTAPLAVQFTDASTGSPTSWAWDFENDGIVDSTDQNPSHTYATAGTYTVNLTVGNAAGSDVEVKVGYVTVGSSVAPVANFTATPLSGEVPLTVQFTDASTEFPTAWAWDFGDGNASTEQNPQHTYTTTGTYSVNLTVSNGVGTDSIVRTGYIRVEDARVLTSITVSPTEAELKVGERQKFTARLLDQQGDIMNGVNLAWASGNESVGTIDGTGMFTALTPGETTITASNGSVQDTANVLVAASSGEQNRTSTFDIPGCNITENPNGTTTVSINTSAANVAVGGNEIVIREETFTVTITTEGSPEVNNGTVNGTVAGIRIDTVPVVTDFGEAGMVSAAVGVNLTGIPSGAGLDVTVSDNVSTDARSAFELAASQDGLTVDAVAYVMNINRTNLDNGADITDATIRMSVSSAWVAAHGGNTSIQIIRWAEDGTKEVLETRSLGFDGDKEIFEAFSPNGLSLFGLATTTASPSTPSGASSSSGGGRSAIGVGATENIKAGETVTLTFDGAPVSEIVIHAQSDIPGILVTTEAGKRPEDAGDPDGEVYKYISVMSYRAPEGSLKWATIRFVVPANWVDERLSSPDLLSLYRYDEETGEWILLSTVFAGEESGSYAYYADSASLGYFAIVAKPDVKEVTASPVTPAGDNQEGQEAEGKAASADPATTLRATPVFGGGMIVCVAVVLFCVLVLLNRRRR